MTSFSAARLPALAEGRGFGREASAAATVVVGAVGAVATAVTVWAVSQSPVLVGPHTMAIVRGLFVASYVGVGMYTWHRRPVSRLGPLFIGAGLLYSLVSFDASGRPLLYAIGRTQLEVFVVYLAYLLVCFPRDRLGSSADRRFIVGFSAASATAWALALALSDRLPAGGAFADRGDRCPHNPLALVAASGSVTQVTDFLVNAVTTAGLLWTVVLILRKAGSPSRLRRRAVTPVLLGATVLTLSYLVYSLLIKSHAGSHSNLLRAVTAGSALVIPYALLAGQIRGHAFAVASLGRFVARAGDQRITASRVERLIGDALGDPSVVLALAAPAATGYVDVHGAALELANDPRGALSYRLCATGYRSPPSSTTRPCLRIWRSSRLSPRPP